MRHIIAFGFYFLLGTFISFAQNAPVTVNDAYTTPLGTQLTIDVAAGILANDTDPDADAISVVGFIVNGVRYNAGQTVGTAGGSINIAADGSFTFNPNAAFDGSIPVIAYIISDGTLFGYGNLNISILSDAAPVARDDFDTADINSSIDVPAPGVLSNDTYQDPATISVISFSVNGNNFNAGQTANTGVGSITIFADGSYIFTPAAGYTGGVPPIIYTISDGNNTSTASLLLTVEEVEDLLILEGLTSCNQGYTTDGNYKIEFRFGFRNESNARDYHSSSIINTIQLTKEFDQIYGMGCVIELENFTISSPPVDNFIGNPYPIDYDTDAVNQDFLVGDTSEMFTDDVVEIGALFPRQRVVISFCLVIEPFCGGRPNPTPSGSGVDFEAEINLTSTEDPLNSILLLEDFHTTEAIITAGFFIPDNTPPVNPDGTFDFVNTVVLRNDGNGIANNVNFNMGLGAFFDNNLSFSILDITQVSGPPVTINPNYDGDNNSLLLAPNNSLAPDETIVLEIFHLLDPVTFTGNNSFFQVNPSQTQGILDGFDESTQDNQRLYTYAIWEDGLGSHLDRYYSTNTIEQSPVNDQCACITSGMSFQFISLAEAVKEIVAIDTAPDGILEYEELTFHLTVSNISPVVELENLVLQDDLSDICDVNPISFTAPEIVSSNATINPTLNPNYDGITDINIFDGNSGLLNTGESITVEITVVFSEDCVGANSINFSGIDPVGNIATASGTIPVDTTADNDNDGIPNFIDIDDDNDTILDTEESNGQDPLNDHDNDFIPNYRDTDFGPDANNDGIVDSFDFDGDGVPNHFDLDADGDGIFDIQEVNNQDNDTDDDGMTNNPVGFNGLDNTVETNDSGNASVTYIIPNSDNDPNNDYLDIDSDGDGIVDNIEVQPTDNYVSPTGTVTETGLDISYLNGLTPEDTDGDLIFDYVDINSDNDIRDDFIEGWDFDSDGVPETTASGTDIDNDGLDDAFDNNTSLVNPTNAQVPTDFPNVDYDVTPERDWRELMAVVVIIDDVTDIEGNIFEFTISLVRYVDNTEPIESATPIDITLFSVDGSLNAGEFNIAVAPLDYTAVEDVVINIPPFTNTFTFSVPTVDDSLSELDEDFTLNGNITSNNTVNNEIDGIGTIIDNEPPPTITMNDDIVFEGEDLVYTISIDIPSSSPIIINMSSVDITATANADYVPINETFVIEATTDLFNPNLEITFNVATFLDNENEPDEEYLNMVGNVASNNVTNPNIIQLGTILDLEPEPLVVITDDTVFEGNTLEFTISLINSDGELMTNFSPIDFEIETIDITTTSGLDYPYINVFDLIPAGESSLTIEVNTFNDNLNETNEFLNLAATIISGTVANPTNLVLGLGTIIDNDIPNLFTPNNDGQSDVFRIANLENYPNFELIIFDRWGGEIYNYKNNGNPNPQWWDGTKNGNPVIEGVYFYELIYNDGFTPPRTGFIQLAR